MGTSRYPVAMFQDESNISDERRFSVTAAMIRLSNLSPAAGLNAPP
jgi:hypothetical protein